jgi:transposase-like protein
VDIFLSPKRRQKMRITMVYPKAYKLEAVRIYVESVKGNVIRRARSTMISTLKGWIDKHTSEIKSEEKNIS